MLRLQNTGGTYSLTGRDGIASSHLSSKLPHPWPQISKLKQSRSSAKHSQHFISAPGQVWKQRAPIPWAPLLFSVLPGMNSLSSQPCSQAFTNASLAKIEMATVIQLFTHSSSCVDLPRYTASAGQQITQHTTWPKPGSAFYLREKKNLWLRHFSTSLNLFSTFFPQ